MFDTQKFGGYLSRLRKNADMTQMELADRLNLTRQAVSRYENGISFPDVSILVLIADIFHITLDELIGAGEPTCGESLILSNIAEGNTDFTADTVEDIIGLAPFLKPSILDRLSAGLSKQGIDISSIVSLAEYLNDDSVIAMLEHSRFETVSLALLERLMPLLDMKSKSVILTKIFAGEMDWHFLRPMLLWEDDFVMQTQVEAAILDGALPWEVLDDVKEAQQTILERWRRSIEE